MLDTITNYGMIISWIMGLGFMIAGNPSIALIFWAMPAGYGTGGAIAEIFWSRK